MRSFERIVVGIDLTPECPDVWREATAVASAFEAELVLVHSVEGCEARTPAFDQARRGVEARLADLRRAAVEEGVRVASTAEVRPGDPAGAILDVAREVGADLVIIGAGARAGRESVILGSAAERVVREAAAPVWVVRPGKGHARFERVLVAADPRAPQPDAMQAAGLMALALDARLTVLSITPERAGHDQIEARLRAALADATADGLALAVEVRQAPKPAAELVGVVQRDDIALLVMGESDRPDSPFTRSTVEKVLRLVPCSILRVRPVHAPAPGRAAAHAPSV